MGKPTSSKGDAAPARFNERRPGPAGCDGDRLIILSFALRRSEEVRAHRPKSAILDEKNESWSNSREKFGKNTVRRIVSRKRRASGTLHCRFGRRTSANANLHRKSASRTGTRRAPQFPGTASNTPGIIVPHDLQAPSSFNFQSSRRTSPARSPPLHSPDSTCFPPPDREHCRCSSTSGRFASRFPGAGERLRRSAWHVHHPEIRMKRRKVQRNVAPQTFTHPLRQPLDLVVRIVVAGNQQRRNLQPDVWFRGECIPESPAPDLQLAQTDLPVELSVKAFRSILAASMCDRTRPAAPGKISPAETATALIPRSRHACATSTAYSRKITGSLYVNATLRQSSSAAARAIVSGSARSASVSTSRDLLMSQF